jgi:hypothetical protein
MDQFSKHPLYMRHNIDSAMGTIWNFYRERFLPLFLISFFMSLVVQYIASLINIQEIAGITDPEAMLSKLRELIWPLLTVSLVSFVFNLILQYYIIFKPLDDNITIFSSAINSLKFFLPYLIMLIVLSLAASIAVLLGLMVFVVGVIFSLVYILNIFLFLLPVMMTEGPNIGNTIQRSLLLSHRYFWSNMGWVSVFLIILVVISVVLSSIILIPFSGSFIKTIMNPGEATDLVNIAKNPVYIVISALAGALTMPLMPLFSCVLYFNARAREASGTDVTEQLSEESRVRVEDLYAKPYADDHPDNPDNTEVKS